MKSTAPLAPRDTRVEMTQIVLPQFTNALGTVFGGQIAAWMDICAAVSAQRYSHGNVVTASFDELSFLVAVKQGMVVILKSQVNMAWRTSMEVGVRIDAEESVHRRAPALLFGVPDLRGRRSAQHSATGAAFRRGRRPALAAPRPRSATAQGQPVEHASPAPAGGRWGLNRPRCPQVGCRLAQRSAHGWLPVRWPGSGRVLNERCTGRPGACRPARRCRS